jgi:predicted DNA-binding transcriptional regulator YafY
MSHQHETILRQWQMLRYIPRFPGKITARILQTRLTSDGYVISKRTIERDLNHLSLTFPLVQDDRDKEYGWSWQKNAPSFDLPGLSNHEALTFVMVEQQLSNLLPSSTLSHLKPYFEMAHNQLNNAIKTSNIKSWLSKIRTIQPNQTLLAPEVNQDIQQVVTEALLQDKQIKIKYKNRDGATKEFSLHPMGLVQRGGVIYLNGLINDFTDLRMLALHRIIAAELLEDAIQKIPNYSLDEEIKKGFFDFGRGEFINLKAHFTFESGKHLLESPLSVDQKINVIEDQLAIEASVPNTPQLLWWLLAFGDGVEVIEPSELRAKISETLKKATAQYS